MFVFKFFGQKNQQKSSEGNQTLDRQEILVGWINSSLGFVDNNTI